MRRTVVFGINRCPASALAVLFRVAVWALAASLWGCGSAPPAPAAPNQRTSASAPAVPIAPAAPTGAVDGARGSVVGRNERLLIYLPEAGDSLAAVAGSEN